jgi:hypothetical protein
MIPVTRPPPHGSHAHVEAKLLDEVRQRIAHGQRPDVDAREMWQLSFEPLVRHWESAWGPREKGLYKTALAGPAGTRRESKCVWCESLRSVHAELSVDHYRPKGNVTRWIGTPPEDSDERPTESPASEDGYWWLGYAWHNWNLACVGCNATWKRCLFPRRVHLPIVEGVETTEAPLLLDPTSGFATRDHFRWDSSGRIYGVSEEGRATIITCGLNRTVLKDARRTKIPDIAEALRGFRRALLGDRDDELGEAAQKLCSFGVASAEFAGMARHFIESDHQLGMTWEALEASTAAWR